MTKRVLVVVDLQEYFCRPGPAQARFIAALGQPGATDGTMVPNPSALLAEFRARDKIVLFTEFGSRSAGGSDLPGAGPPGGAAWHRPLASAARRAGEVMTNA